MTVLFILILFILSSCKKSTSETTAEKLQHTWNLVTETDNDTPTGAFKTYNGNPKDIMTFNSDGTVLINLYGDYGNPDIEPYSLINDTQILVYWNLNKPDTFVIKTLTNSQLTLYRRVIEETTTFKR